MGTTGEERPLRSGDLVTVNGRNAIFLYARRGAAVIRYVGERASRVVSLRKLS